MKSLDQVADVLIDSHELRMLHQMIANEGLTLWSTAHDVQVVLTAFSLKNDYALFKQRIEQLVTDGMSVLAAYASLTPEDVAFLPFLQNLLAERGIPEDQSSLLNALANVRHQMQLHGFAKDLEQRRQGSHARCGLLLPGVVLRPSHSLDIRGNIPPGRLVHIQPD